VSAPAVDVAVRRRAGSRIVGWVTTHRALSAAALVWILFAANFNLFSVSYGSDPMRPFGFVQRLFGDGHSADAYQFGLALGEAPFYAIGKLVYAAGVHSIGGKPVLAGFAVISASVFVLAAAAAIYPVLQGLRLRRPALVLLCSVFGTPLFYYGTFQPGHTHAFDTLLFTGVVALLFLYFRKEGGSPMLAAAMGMLLAFSMTVRYFTGAEAVALVLGLLWYRRRRDAALVVASLVVGLGLPALAAYLIVGGVFNDAAGPNSTGLRSALGVLVFAPLNPVRMLFTNHRGLFVWSPVALVALVGFVRLLRRRPDQRPFLAISGAMGVAIVGSYAFSPHWEGGLSFGQRYLTPLFPLVALGLGGLLDWRPRLVASAAGLAVAWTLVLGLYDGLGFGLDDHLGASQVPDAVLKGKVTPGLVAYNLYRVSNLSFVIPDPYAH
jgi:hypothetical protein